jgi:uncharacterized protein YjbI with pentapeptide repeats
VRTARHGRAEVVLPDIDGDLAEVGELGDAEQLADFVYSDRSLRQLDLAGRRLARGRVRGVEVERTNFDTALFESLSFERCAILSGHWEGGSLSRVQLTDCKILGVTVSEQKWSNVVFRGCVIEYVTFDAVRATGPVAFVECRMRDVTLTNCHLPRGHMSDCELNAVELVGGNFRDFDFRGNDLSTLRGAASLGGAIVSHEQRPQLAEALIAELDLTYVEGNL